MTSTELSLQRYFPWLLAMGILLNVPGLWLDVMEPDGALYATIAKHIVLHNDWVNLYGDGHDWLDKPHFPFWMAALSYKVLGISGFAYKFPAFIFWLASLFYTYVTARDLYNVNVAKISLLIYTIALHSTLANFDVRAEPYLTACTIAAVWHMLNIYKGKHWLHIVAAAFFIACAIMTKGIFILITIGSGWVIFLVITKQWKQFINYRWWIMLGLSFIFILPELYSLYVQFDLHPEKIVFGRTHVSGLRFFFWDSQFGRFFNTGPIRGRGDLSFFLHTTLWAFLPWSAGLVGGLVYLFRFERDDTSSRWIVYGSALVTFILFSLSKFQLPHYIVIEFPYFAIITGYFLYQKANDPVLKWFAGIQSGLLYVLCGLILYLFYITNIQNAWIGAVSAISIVAVSALLREKIVLRKILFRGYATALMLYIFLFFFFYPFLLQYQSGASAARMISRTDDDIPVAAYQSFSYAFEFYSPAGVSLINNNKQLNDFMDKNPCYLYTSAAVGDSLIRSGVDAQIVSASQNFHITKLKIGFLDYKKRGQSLEKRYLLYIHDSDIN